MNHYNNQQPLKPVEQHKRNTAKGRKDIDGQNMDKIETIAFGYNS